MRIQRILVGAALLMLCAAAAYAQVGVSSTPVQTVINSGHAELAGNVRLSVTGPGIASAVSDTFTFRFGGLNVTNSIGATGIGIGPLSTWAGCAVTGLDRVLGIVTVTGCATGAAVGTFFDLVGVRLNMEGSAAPVSVTIGTLFNLITAGESSAVVIQTSSAGVISGSAATNPINLLATGIPTTPTGAWFLTEGFPTAWKTLAQAGADATQGTQIQLTLAGLPTGVTVTMAPDCAAVTVPPLAPPALICTVSGTTFTSAVTQRIISFTNADPTVVDKITFAFTVAVGSSASLPLAPATYAISATMAPVQAALGSGNSLPAAPVFIPRFADVEVPVPGFNVLNISPITTSFIVPYVTTATGYDTGISIANTTKDPFVAPGGAVPQNGAMTFYFYGNDGSAVVTYTTAAGSPGSGLTGATLNAGSTYVALASQILAAAGRTTPFTGYAIIVVQVTNAHGSAFISNFAGFASATPMLTIANPAITARTGSWEVTSR